MKGRRKKKGAFCRYTGGGDSLLRLSSEGSGIGRYFLGEKGESTLLWKKEERLLGKSLGGPRKGGKILSSQEGRGIPGRKAGISTSWENDVRKSSSAYFVIRRGKREKGDICVTAGRKSRLQKEKPLHGGGGKMIYPLLKSIVFGFEGALSGKRDLSRFFRGASYFRKRGESLTKGP